jgi:hypothetical protein
MSRGRPISPKNPQGIIDRYLAGESAKQIAQDFGYTDGHAVYKFLKGAGVPIRTNAEALANRTGRAQ